MLVFDVIYRWDGWAGLLVAPLLWKLAWYLHAVKVSPGATATLSLSLCTFRTAPAQGSFGLFLK